MLPGKPNLGDKLDKLPPVRIFRDPMSWLKAGCDGFVILDGDRARDELWHVGRLAAQDEVLGRRLKMLMARPPWPGQVLIPRRKAA